MRFPRTWLMLGGGAYALFLVATIPAEMALGMVRNRMPDLAATGVEGTVWRGRAQALHAAALDIGPVAWSFRPLALPMLRLEYDAFFQAPGGGGELRLGRGLFGDPAIRALRASFDAGTVQQWLRLPGVALAGRFETDIDRLVPGEGRVPAAVEGRITWMDARVTRPVDLALGALELVLETEEQQILGRLGDKGGPLEVSGELFLTPGGSYRIEGRLKPRPEAGAGLRDALALLGSPDRDGRYRFSYAGRL